MARVYLFVCLFLGLLKMRKPLNSNTNNCAVCRSKKFYTTIY